MIKLLKKYLKGYVAISFLGPLFKLFEAVIELFIPIIVALIIDNGIPNKDTSYIFNMGGIMLALYIAGFLCSLICQYFAAKSGFGFGTNLRRALYKHINSLSLSDIDKFQTPTLIMRVNNDCTNAQTALNRFIRLVTRAPFILIGALIMAIRINPWLSVIFFAASVLIALALFLVLWLSSPKIKEINKSNDDIALKTRQNLSGARVIRAFNKQNNEEQGFDRSSNKLKKESILLGAISALTNPLTYLIINCAVLCILYFGGITVNSGQLSQGRIIALINYLLQILNALTIIAALMVIFSRAVASAKRINEVFSVTPESTGGVQDIPQNDIALEFKNVSVKYPKNSANSLNNITFKLEKGKTLGIIGGTGSGKTTLISVIPRLYDYEGEILFYGTDLKDCGRAAVRDLIGAADQKAVLFSGNIRDNMLFSNPLASDEDIMLTLKTAQAGFIGSPDALVSRGGANFSGGQKQRLNIARALIKNPRLLILDDALSALDYVTEAKVKKELNKLKDVTKIIVSQRAASVKTADLIIVLDNGYAVATGKHQDLLNTCPLYREINEIQGGTL